MQRRGAGSHLDKRVHLDKIRPDRRNYAQLPAVVVKRYVALVINMAVFKKIKVFAAEWMEGVCDSDSTAYFRPDGCIRAAIQTGDH